MALTSRRGLRLVARSVAGVVVVLAVGTISMTNGPPAAPDASGSRTSAAPAASIDTRPIDTRSIDTRPIDTRPIDTGTIDAESTTAMPISKASTNQAAHPSSSKTEAVARSHTVVGSSVAAADAGPSAGPSSGPPIADHSPTMRIAFAGDVNFSERTAERLAADPAHAFGAAAPGLRAADFAVVNLETAITERGEPAPKQFHFRAPATAFAALRAAGVDAASMANNHASDYGEQGIADSVAAIAESRFPVIGFGATAETAYAPVVFDKGRQSVAIFAATAVPDWTLATWRAENERPGVAAADDPRLLAAVSAAAEQGKTVIVYLHWGTEYQQCPDGTQQRLATQLAEAGAAAVVGTHAHVLQGMGWRDDGTYVAYGLGNFLWWRSFGNTQDDNGVLTLTLESGAVTGAEFVPAHLDATGVPVPATGREAERITEQLVAANACAALRPEPPN